MSGDVLTHYTGQVSTLLQSRLRIKGRTLARQVARLDRRVPKSVRRDAAYLARAETMTQHPKLALMINDSQVKRAGDNVVSHLEAIDPKAVMQDKILRTLAKFSALLIVIFVFAVWYAWDRGLV